MTQCTHRLGALALSILGLTAVACGGEPLSPADAGATRGDAAPADVPTVDAGTIHDLDSGAGDAPDAYPDAGPTNRAPTITRFEAQPASGLLPLHVDFQWWVEDPDADPLTCELDSGDGAPPRNLDCATTASVSYAQEGSFTARLTARDPAGAQSNAELQVRAERVFTLPTYLDADFGGSGTRLPDLDLVASACRVEVAGTPGEDLTAALQAAVNQAATQAPPQGHCVVELPAGGFELGQTITLHDGVVVRGQGAALTTLTAALGGAVPAFSARGGAAELSYEGEEVRGLKGERELTVTSTLARQASLLLTEAGRVYGELSIDNDPVKFPAEWERDYAAFGIGQVFEVRAVQGEALILDRPLNEPYLRAGLVRRLELRGAGRMLERAGLADLRLVRADNHHAGTVSFDRTVGAFLLRVALEKTGWAQVHVDRSLACAITQSYFFDAHDFGDGGQGYGINLRHHTTGCRIEDNNFRRLRHAMIVQLGSNGNVLAYNYAEDARDNLGWLKADISLHGHYTHMNLIEGNVVEKIHVSDWWGPAPFHVVFHNRVSRGGVFVDDRSHETAVIDNVSEANFPLERALQVHSSVRTPLCVNNLSPQGDVLSSAHSECDDENDAATHHERARPTSFYRAESLMAPDGSIPAQQRLQSGIPVPAR